MSQPEPERLIRGIHRWDLVALAINGIIGAGIFGLPSRVFALIGPYSLLAFAACALVVTLIILCFAEVGSRYTKTGGPYLYAREAFGPLVGFEVGWLMWIARVTAFAANSNMLVEYLGFFWPAVTQGFWRSSVLTTLVLLMTVINVVGVRSAALFGNLFAIGKLIPLVIFAAAGMFFINPEAFELSDRPGYADFSNSVLLLVYAFTGFEMAVIPAGEVRDPRRNLPVAILTAIAFVAVLYLSIQVVCVGTLQGLAHSERPLADAAHGFLGPAGAALIAAGAVVSVIGNLNVVLLAASRIPFAMGERRELLPALALTHPRFRTPHVALLATSAVTFVITISGSFTYAVTVSAIARLVAYAATAAALPTLRRRMGAPPAMFRLPAGAAVAVSVVLLAAWLVSNSTFRETRDAAIAAAAGIAMYLACRRGAHPPENRATIGVK
jgi:amino acid transporter